MCNIFHQRMPLVKLLLSDVNKKKRQQTWYEKFVIFLKATTGRQITGVRGAPSFTDCVVAISPVSDQCVWKGQWLLSRWGVLLQWQLGVAPGFPVVTDFTESCQLELHKLETWMNLETVVQSEASPNRKTNVVY